MKPSPDWERDKIFFDELECFKASRSGRRLSYKGLVYHIPTGIWRYYGIKMDINNSNDIKRIVGED